MRALFALFLLLAAAEAASESSATMSGASIDSSIESHAIAPWIDENTPIPGTLNELVPTDAARDEVTHAEDPGADQEDPTQIEDPGVFEDKPGVFVDEHGPFRIGEPMEIPGGDPIAQCRTARHNLAILGEAWPVYRDEQGKLRHQWARDPYRGARQYLDSEARQRARAAAEQMQSRDCPAASARGAEVSSISEARDELLRTALCEAERAELLALENVIGSTEDARARKRALAAEVCGEKLVNNP